MSFRARSRAALADAALQKALANVPPGFVAKRARAVAAWADFESVRKTAAAHKRAVLADLETHLARFTERAEATGARVHEVATAEQARAVITDILRRAGARAVVKGKSMISEEIDLTAALQKAGFAVTETDLGEYIIQLRHERPSHIIAPAVHLSREQIAADFLNAHDDLPPDRDMADNAALVEEARAVLRQRFCAADAGIIGANALIAETGTTMLVTNEGNGDLCANLPRLLIVIASIEKLVADFAGAANLIRLLARSATGQEISVYTSFFTGVRRDDEAGGPEEMHIVLLDNGRRALLGTPFSDMLACIRCGACLNHCPVFQAVGGHAYGNVYPGPMGLALQPALKPTALADGIIEGCTMCGRCAEVCPMLIPLPDLIRQHRFRAHEKGYGARAVRGGLRLWAWLAARPAAYRLATRLGGWLLRRFPMLARARGRNVPVPAGAPFMVRRRS